MYRYTSMYRYTIYNVCHSPFPNMYRYTRLLQPVPEQIRPETVLEIQNGVLYGQHSCLFSNELYAKTPLMSQNEFGCDVV